MQRFTFHYPDKVELRGYKPTFKGNMQQIKRAAEEIANSCMPIIYAGGGVISSNASSELIELAETLNAPVTTTLLGIGSIPTEHPLYVGMLGMHGCKYANYAIQESDLIIAVGAQGLTTVLQASLNPLLPMPGLSILMSILLKFLRT